MAPKARCPVRAGFLATVSVFVLLCGRPQVVAGQWQLSAQPTLSIDAFDREGKEADGVRFGRIAGVVRLSTGTIAVADASNLTIALFTPQGALIRSTGRIGEGPGEFRTIASLRLCPADTLLVFDPALRRLTVFGPEGRLARTIDLGRTSPGIRPYDVWCTSRGSILALNRTASPPSAIGPHRPAAALLLLTPGGALDRELDRLPGPERYFDGRQDFPRPLGRRTVVAVAGAMVYAGTEEVAKARDSIAIRAYHLPDGASRMFRAGARRIPITARLVDRFIDEQIGFDDSGSNAANRRAYLRALDYPAFLPAYIRILAEHDGRIWVEGYRAPGAATRTWRVYQPDGHLLATVTVPGSLELSVVEPRGALGIWRDADGTESIRLYGLVRE